MKKRWIFEVVETKEGQHLSRTNDGFSPLELLGLLEFTRAEVIKQMEGEIHPDIVTRKVIVDSSRKPGGKK